MYNIYALLCANDRYYIGKTKKSVAIRFQEHVNGKGAAWTMKYTPIKILEEKKGDKWAEDTMTFTYMEKYTIEHVRGGTYCQVVLNKSQLTEINMRLKSVNDKCYTCGLAGHFAKTCTTSVHVCTRCGRNNHSIANCHAGTHIDGYKLEPLEIDVPDIPPVTIAINPIKRIITSAHVCTRCGRNNHLIANCYAGANIDGHKLEPLEIKVPDVPDIPPVAIVINPIKRIITSAHVCTRCGRNNHSIENCYAGAHIDGHKLEPLEIKVREIKALDIPPPVAIVINPIKYIITPTIPVVSVKLTTLTNASVNNVTCNRCGNSSHGKCEASRHVDGRFLHNYPLPFGVQCVKTLNTLKFENGEVLCFYFLNRLDNYVVLTNRRFIKMENQKMVSCVGLDKISSVAHRKNGIFNWDSIQILEHNGRNETFGIYESDIAAFFARRLLECISN